MSQCWSWRGGQSDCYRITLGDCLQGVRGIFALRTSETKMPTRRVFLAAFLTACSRAESAVRLHARPVQVAIAGLKPGVTPLSLRPQRDALVYFPSSAPDPAPLSLPLPVPTATD